MQASNKRFVLRRRPTGRGGLLLLCGFGLFLLATHFSSNAVFLLAFFCISLPLCAPIAVWRTPARAALVALPTEPAAAGEPISLRFHLMPYPRGTAEYTIHTGFGDAVENRATNEWVARIPPLKRGVYHPGPIRVSCRDPLGLFCVSRDLTADEAAGIHKLVVYPRPDWSNPAQAVGHKMAGTTTAPTGEIAGLRDYRRGDPQQSVDWRASARTEVLMVREYERHADEGACMFDGRSASGEKAERMLSCLTAGVLEAARNGAPTGLRLAALEIAPKRGAKHLETILHALARHAAHPETEQQA